MKPILVDAHLDLAYNAVVLGRDLLRSVGEIRHLEAATPPPGGPAGTCMTTLLALLEGRVAIVGGSLFVAPDFKGSREPQPYHTPQEAHRHAVLQLDYYRRLSDENEQVVLLNTLNDMLEQLEGNGVDPAKDQFVLGPALTYDRKTERFVGAGAEKANKYIACSYREPFVMPKDL